MAGIASLDWTKAAGYGRISLVVYRATTGRRGAFRILSTPAVPPDGEFQAGRTRVPVGSPQVPGLRIWPRLPEGGRDWPVDTESDENAP